MKGAGLTDKIPFLIHKTGAVNGDFLAFPTVLGHFSLGGGGPPSGREESSSSKPVHFFPSVSAANKDTN